MDRICIAHVFLRVPLLNCTCSSISFLARDSTNPHRRGSLCVSFRNSVAPVCIMALIEINDSPPGWRPDKNRGVQTEDVGMLGSKTKNNFARGSEVGNTAFLIAARWSQGYQLRLQLFAGSFAWSFWIRMSGKQVEVSGNRVTY